MPPDAVISIEVVYAAAEVQEVIVFCRTAKRGVARFVPWSRRKNILHEEME